MTHQFKYIFYCNSKIHSVCTRMLHYTYIFLYLLSIGELFQPVILWILWFHSIQIICIIQHKLISGPFPWQCVIWVLRSLERDLLFVIVSSTLLAPFSILLGWDIVFAYLLLNIGVFHATIKFFILPEDLNSVVIYLPCIITLVVSAFSLLCFVFYM